MALKLVVPIPTEYQPGLQGYSSIYLKPNLTEISMKNIFIITKLL